MKKNNVIIPVIILVLGLISLTVGLVLSTGGSKELETTPEDNETIVDKDETPEVTPTPSEESNPVEQTPNIPQESTPQEEPSVPPLEPETNFTIKK